MMANGEWNVLRVDASGRRQGSVSRLLGDGFITALERGGGLAGLVRRDLADGMPYVDDPWIAANFTDPDGRSKAQREALAGSDMLVGELFAADLLVIATPIYNFAIPAALKAWIDQVARARETFRYTAEGSVGLLKGRRAVVTLASGGVPVGSAVDFATGYLRHVLGFMGIDDVECVAADGLGRDGEVKITAAREALDALGAWLSDPERGQ